MHTDTLFTHNIISLCTISVCYVVYALSIHICLFYRFLIVCARWGVCICANINDAYCLIYWIRAARNYQALNLEYAQRSKCIYNRKKQTILARGCLEEYEKTTFARIETYALL